MKRLACLAAIMFLVGSGAASAAVVTYTNSAAFLAALGGASAVTTEGYENLAPNSTIPNGATVNGLTYSGFSRAGGRVDNSYNRIGNLSLAMSTAAGGPDFFQPGEGFTVDFGGAVSAFGLFFNIGLAPAGTLSVSTAEGTAFNGPAYDQSTLFFVGLISDTPFSTATILGVSTVSGYNVDNLMFQRVPEPLTLALALTALAGLGASRLRAGRAA